MKYKVIVSPEAENDLSKAFSWYEGKLPGLDYNFLFQTDAGINLLCKSPIFYERTTHMQSYEKNHLLSSGIFSIVRFVVGIFQ